MLSGQPKDNTWMPLAAMSEKSGTLLFVVDADILRAAGYSKGHASQVRGLLNAIYEICHRVVVSEEARSEWDKHASGISLNWWTRMSNRGKIQRIRLHLTDHEEALEASGVAPERLPGLTKDLHLVVAALEHGDNIVISNDRRAARGFKELSLVIEKYGAVSWWNADHPIPSRSPE